MTETKQFKKFCKVSLSRIRSNNDHSNLNVHINTHRILTSKLQSNQRRRKNTIKTTFLAHTHARTRTHSTFILKQILGWWTVGHRFSHCFPIEVKESIALVPNIYQCVHNFFPLQCGMAHDLQPKTFISEVFPCYELRVLTTHCRVHSVAAMVLCACVRLFRASKQ